MRNSATSRSHLPPGTDPATIVDDGINPPYIASGRPYVPPARPAAPAAASRLPEGSTLTDSTTRDPAQPQKAPASKWAQDAQHPEKALFRIWGLLALGIAIRVISPMLATGGIMVISGTAVLATLILPAVLAGTTLYYNKQLKDAGKGWLIGSAAVTTAFGIYLLIWATS